LCVGCLGTESGNPPLTDAGPDTAYNDAAADTARDSARPDTSFDARPDVPFDAVADTSFDAVTDTSFDVGCDGSAADAGLLGDSCEGAALSDAGPQLECNPTCASGLCLAGEERATCQRNG
jgi:hypothetical protein